MKKNLILILLIVFAVLVVYADSGEYHWYRASTGTTADAFPDVGESSTNTNEPGNPGDNGGGTGGGNWLVNIVVDENGFTPVFAFPNNDNIGSGLTRSVDFTKNYTFSFTFTMVNDTTVKVSYTFGDGDDSETENLGQWTLLLEDKPGQMKPLDMYKSIFHSQAVEGHGSHALRGLYFEFDEEFGLTTLTVLNEFENHDPDLRVYLEGTSNNDNGDKVNSKKDLVYNFEEDKGKDKKK